MPSLPAVLANLLWVSPPGIDVTGALAYDLDGFDRPMITYVEHGASRYSTLRAEAVCDCPDGVAPHCKCPAILIDSIDIENRPN